ncbi:MAG: hypothetical protein JXB48_13995, partial [Candidatus Latescibacteria bacterium]|nr:hypothetical protein [Candidatus Latescibacterota bacterium]
MRNIFLSVEFWKFALPLFGAVIAWFVNEWRKRLWEQYQRKEASYKELVRCLRGFYIGTENADCLKGKFIDQLNQCWLYCPDEVIKKRYAFLDNVHTNQVHPDNVKEKAMGEFIVAIRKDLLSRALVRCTKLTGGDFKHLKV